MDMGILSNKGDAHNWITIVLFFIYEESMKMGISGFFLFSCLSCWASDLEKQDRQIITTTLAYIGPVYTVWCHLGHLLFIPKDGRNKRTGCSAPPCCVTRQLLSNTIINLAHLSLYLFRNCGDNSRLFYDGTRSLVCLCLIIRLFQDVKKKE